VVEEGLRLMLIGMSGVFGFLLLLVGLMQASGRVWSVLAAWFPEPASVKPGAAISTGLQGAELEEIAVALAVASAARKAGGN
jgi:Na+-transporting methylmalonyl-CoA/oxaloacetate decarboxylase gamma subunit